MDRRVVILNREADGRYRRVDEEYHLVLYDVTAVTVALETIGFAVEVRPSFTEATASQPASGCPRRHEVQGLNLSPAISGLRNPSDGDAHGGTGPASRRRYRASRGRLGSRACNRSRRATSGDRFLAAATWSRLASGPRSRTSCR